VGSGDRPGLARPHVVEQREQAVLVEQRHALGAGALGLAGAEAGVVAHQRAGDPADGVADVEARGDEPLHQARPRLPGGPGDHQLHPLHERGAGGPAARVAPRARWRRHPRRPARRALPGRVDHRQRQAEPGGEQQAVRQHPGEHLQVVVGVVRPLLRDAPVLGEGAEPVVGHVEAEPPAQREGAQPLLHRQREAGPLRLGGQEAVVEGGVVGDQDAAVEHLVQLRGDLGEPGCPGEAVPGQAVDVHGAGVAAGVDQGGEARPDGTAGGVERERGDAQHPVAVRVQARGLDVHHRPRVVGLEQAVDLGGRHGGGSPHGPAREGAPGDGERRHRAADPVIAVRFRSVTGPGGGPARGPRAPRTW
jgi:hypothetical protein